MPRQDDSSDDTDRRSKSGSQPVTTLSPTHGLELPRLGDATQQDDDLLTRLVDVQDSLLQADLHVKGETMQLSLPVCLVRALIETKRTREQLILVYADQEVSPDGAASLVGISRPHMTALIKSEAIPLHRKVGKHHRVLVRDVIEFAQRRAQPRSRIPESARTIEVSRGGKPEDPATSRGVADGLLQDLIESPARSRRLYPRGGFADLEPFSLQVLVAATQHGWVTIDDLAEELALARLTILHAVRILRRRQLLEERRDEYDRRRRLYRATPAGKQLASRFIAHTTRRLTTMPRGR